MAIYFRERRNDAVRYTEAYNTLFSAYLEGVGFPRWRRKFVRKNTSAYWRLLSRRLRSALAAVMYENTFCWYGCWNLIRLESSLSTIFIMAVMVHTGHKASKIAKKEKLFDASVICDASDTDFIYYIRKSTGKGRFRYVTRGFWKDWY